MLVRHLLKKFELDEDYPGNETNEVVINKINFFVPSPKERLGSDDYM
jgi:hypothetical protein